ncbi:response regulator [Actimicrobium sp. CCC2.4]|uniref:response regulator n=1 Tax=Actimicrobium sp. CCC2.4 TaxID=3048606 RepID=UPI002AC908C2|nr:response regulator [Actimicrobium sp. CCC2.4]MEB0135129.1 response regulator [Actimicrobium sp. CCC2.4]WPX31826.1 response regulator [Actimicrobium sp. CCC2.4]
MNQPLSPPLQVFLIEDSSLVRELVIESFADIPGITLIGHADSEDEAFDQLERHPCDILILDIQLRQGNGISLLRRLGSTPRHENQIRIIFSNNVSKGYHRLAGQLGVQYFFDKTSEFTDMRELLEQLGNGTAAVPSPRAD